MYLGNMYWDGHVLSYNRLCTINFPRNLEEVYSCILCVLDAIVSSISAEELNVQGVRRSYGSMVTSSNLLSVCKQISNLLSLEGK